MTQFSHLAQSIFWMLGAMISFTLMAVSGRELFSSLDTFEIMLYRSLVGIFLVRKRRYGENETGRKILKKK